MSLAVLNRRRKVGSVDDDSTLSMMNSLFVAIDAAAGLDFDESNNDSEDSSQEVVEVGACSGESDGYIVL